MARRARVNSWVLLNVACVVPPVVCLLFTVMRFYAISERDIRIPADRQRAPILWMTDQSITLFNRRVDGNMWALILASPLVPLIVAWRLRGNKQRALSLASQLEQAEGPKPPPSIQDLEPPSSTSVAAAGRRIHANSVGFNALCEASLVVTFFFLVLWITGFDPYPSWTDAVENRSWAIILSDDAIGFVWKTSDALIDRRVVGLPYWIILLFTGWPPLKWLERRVLLMKVRRDRDRSGLCSGCGYDLRASVGQCSECGMPIKRRNTAAANQD